MEPTVTHRVGNGLLVFVLFLALLLGLAAAGANSLAEVSFKSEQSGQVSIDLRPFLSRVCSDASGSRNCVESIGESYLGPRCPAAIKATAAFEVITLITLLATIGVQGASVCSAYGCLFCCTLVLYVFQVLFVGITAGLAFATPRGPCTLEPLPFQWVLGKTSTLWAGAAAASLAASIGSCSLAFCCPVKPTLVEEDSVMRVSAVKKGSRVTWRDALDEPLVDDDFHYSLTGLRWQHHHRV